MNKISYLDFFSLTEMIGQNVEIKLNNHTIQKIYSTSSGVQMTTYKLTYVLNGLKYAIDNSMVNDTVLFECKYSPTSWQTMEFELF